MKRNLSFIFFLLILMSCQTFSSQYPLTREDYQAPHPHSNNQTIQRLFIEDFGGPKPGFRFKISNVQIERQGSSIHAKRGGSFKVTMDILHDCISCDNAINQIIVGIGGEDHAQVSVWNGKQRSGGPVMTVNAYTAVEASCEDNPGPAEWVKVFFNIQVPDRKGIYYLRARYAQDYQGNLRTAEGLAKWQPEYRKVLGWWKVDRPNGPGPESNIGIIIIE